MDANTFSLILRLVELLAFGLRAAPEVMGEVQALSAELRAMVDEGRDPNADEWANMDARIARARHALSVTS